MPRGPRKWSEDAIEKHYRLGRGKGTGKDYLPWINVAEISSSGRSRRAFGIKSGREHHFLSDVEWNLFLLLEFSPDVVDIREQYPLDRDLTLEIAAALGIGHPYYPGTQVPVVMTTDFLVTRVRNGATILEAFDTKREQEAEDERSIEKLQIQRTYLEGVDIRHHLVFHSAIPLSKTRNIEWIRSAHLKSGEKQTFPGMLDEAARKMTSELRNNSKRSVTLSEYSQTFDRRNGYETGTGLRVARLLIANHMLIADLNNPSLETCPLSAFQIVAAEHVPEMLGAQ
ncbi:TnsA endonuclease C terminal [Collimonas sp. OK307]|uniref:TnsA endonuclease N-terminal domain-containing protein n=1 Tax=Collimonas sp. OK307 TaxID=1801620 RepID=UPI0008F17DD6|nr:TnsA endonuclease N-terminal domain-containing protein [Collimonas sp. OK307]SFI02860.1 TnsA endonuclease C terminal [Collimonas sp. OK307]